MANTNITKPTQAPPNRTPDIFNAMRDEMNRVFERFEHGLPRWPSVFAHSMGQQLVVPELDIHDEGKQLVIEVELPGVDEKNVTATIANGLLTIKGEKKSEYEQKNGNYYVAERSYGAFERTLRLPESIDDSKVEARFDKGVLKIVAQKKPEAVMAEKKIEIKKG